jgi:hypothetical protein
LHGSQTCRRRRLDRKKRRRRTGKARAARQQLQRLHGHLPKPTRSLFDVLAGSFTGPTFLRVVILVVATLLTVGQQAVCNLLRTLGALAPGPPSRYHRVFCKRCWSCWRLARGLAMWVSDHVVPQGSVPLAGTRESTGTKGSRLRQGLPPRPGPLHALVDRLPRGHKWVVLAVLVHFPVVRRLWALPVLVALYRTEKDNARNGRRHRTPAHSLWQLCGVLRSLK